MRCFTCFVVWLDDETDFVGKRPTSNKVTSTRYALTQREAEVRLFVLFKTDCGH